MCEPCLWHFNGIMDFYWQLGVFIGTHRFDIVLVYLCTFDTFFHYRSIRIYTHVLLVNCMFYQLLRVQHSCSSTQSWGSVLPSIVEARDQNSQGYPLLFSNRNLGSFCVWGKEILYTFSLWEVVDHSRSTMQFICLIIIHESGPGIKPGTFGLADECSTTELTLLLI